MHDLRIYAFIQARLGSTRLPRKILSPIPYEVDREVSLLEHIHLRLKRVLPHDRIIFLIPDNEPELEGFLQEKNLNSFLGSHDDVRNRFYKAGKNYQADIILRLTGDNPFPDLEAIETIIDAWMDPHNTMDLIYVSGLPIGMSIESFRFLSLESTMNTQDVNHKEHVTLAIKENPQVYKIGGIPSLSGLDLPSGIRLTIDQDKDLETIREISIRYFDFYKRQDGASNQSTPNASELSIGDLLRIHKEDPEVFRTNEFVEQLKFPLPDSNTGKPICILVYASPNLYGSGHKERCQLLAGRLVARGYNCIGIPVYDITNSLSDVNYQRILAAKPSLIIWDLRDLDYPAILQDLPSIQLDNYSDFDSKSNIQNEKYRDQYLKNIHSRLDLLPHPLSQEWGISPKILCPWLALNPILPDSSERSEPRLFVYSGGLRDDLCDILDKFLMKHFQGYKILRVGYSRSRYLHQKSRLTRYEWWTEMKNSDYFLSYFGQGLIEAIYCDLEVATFYISPDHKILSEWMSRVYGIPMWGDINDLIRNENISFAKAQSLEPNMDRASWMPLL